MVFVKDLSFFTTLTEDQMRLNKSGRAQPQGKGILTAY
jgi:hypothetical protein